jgi:hypothetical protein
VKRRAYPALCLRDGAEALSREELFAKYAAQGFLLFDSAPDWALMRRGVFEALIRKKDSFGVVWTASVIQLAPND